MANINNLRPFTGADDPRRQNGRKKGSKNLSTIVNELLNTEIGSAGLIDNRLEQCFQNSSTTYAKALAMSMILKAVAGDVRAATWVSSYANRCPEPDGFFDRTEFYFNVVPNRSESEK